MGTPDFAVPSLEILLQHHYTVVAVITAPDKPKGRGQKLTYSPVKEFAMRHAIPVLQPTNLKAPEFLEELRTYQANLQIVVAFRMLPEVVWSMPALGTFNLHGSLLPQYRGAAPIHWAVINGETETGVTTFFLKHEIDTGSIIDQEREPIYPNDTTGDVYNRLMIKGAALVLKTVQAIEKGTHEAHPQQTPSTLKHAPKLFKETCEIDWNQASEVIRNFVRGLNPSPTAWCSLNNKNYKIATVSVVNHTTEQLTPGTLYSDNKNYLYVKTADGWVSIDKLQPEGKRFMNIQEFFMGNKL